MKTLLTALATAAMALAFTPSAEAGHRDRDCDRGYRSSRSYGGYGGHHYRSSYHAPRVYRSSYYAPSYYRESYCEPRYVRPACGGYYSRPSFGFSFGVSNY